MYRIVMTQRYYFAFFLRNRFGFWIVVRRSKKYNYLAQRHNMRNDSILLVLFMAAVAGVALYHLVFSKKARIHRRISKVKKKNIGDIRDGEIARVKGKVVYAGKTLIAPLSGRECVYFHITVKDSSSRHDLTKNYVNIDEEWASDVVLYDGENYALLDTRLVQAYIIQDESQLSGFWNFTSEELENFLVSRGMKASDGMGWSLDLRASEGVLEEGELVNVLGLARWRKTSDFKLKLSCEKILYLEPVDAQGIYLTEDQYV